MQPIIKNNKNTHEKIPTYCNFCTDVCSLTELPLKIEIKGVEKPFTAEITPTYTLKNPEDVTINKETYTFSDFGIMISAIGNDGLLMASGSIGYATVDAENIYNYLNECIKDSNGVTSKLEIK